MKHTILMAMAATTTMALSATAAAQGLTPGGKVGVGLSLGNSLIDDVNLASNPQLGGNNLFGHATLLVPLNLVPNLRIEPFLGLSVLSSSTERNEDNFDLTNESTRTALSLGAGVFYTYSPGTNVGIYAGGRLGLVSQSIDDSAEIVVSGGRQTNETSLSRLDGVVSLVVGGEVFLAPYFSVGAEGSLTFGVMGDEERDPEPMNAQDDDDVENTVVAFRTGGALVARFYFN